MIDHSLVAARAAFGDEGATTEAVGLQWRHTRVGPGGIAVASTAASQIADSPALVFDVVDTVAVFAAAHAGGFVAEGDAAVVGAAACAVCCGALVVEAHTDIVAGAHGLVVAHAVASLMHRN